MAKVTRNIPHKNTPEFIHYTGKKPSATLENLAVLLKHIDFSVVFFERTQETHFFLADKNIAILYNRPSAGLGVHLKRNLYLISVCNQYQLPKTSLGFLCEVLKNYPVSVIPDPAKEKTPPEIARKHFDNLRALMSEGVAE